MALNIAFIGAGSVGFTRKLIQDILLVPELADSRFALHDISRDQLDMVAELVGRDIKANRLPAKVSRHLRRKPALEGAHYVINCTRIGGLEAFATDIEIPLKYGVDQCVGDTLCAGGIMYGQRNIPQILDFLRDAREVAHPRCMFFNYANPMAMNTWAALDAFDRGEGIPTVGLCHGIQHGCWQITDALAKLNGIKDVRWQRDLEVICAGINHQTWYLDIRFLGRRIEHEELLTAFERHPVFSKTEKVRIDVLRRFGVYSTESNGHLSEYLPWYRKRPKEIKRWIDRSEWIHGETGGYLRYCTKNQDWFKRDFKENLASAGKPISEWERSHEHGSFIIEAIETGRPYRGFFNVRNNGTIRNLPDDCIIEAPGYVDRHGINMISGIELPQACAATCMASVNVQRMSKDAAVGGDVMLLKQAMMHDPLVSAVCNTDEIWQMADHMLVAQAQWLPNYGKKDIQQAAARLKNAGVDIRATQKAASPKKKKRKAG